MSRWLIIARSRPVILTPHRFFPHQKWPSLQLSSLLSKQWCGAPWSTAPTNKLARAVFHHAWKKLQCRSSNLTERYSYANLIYLDFSTVLYHLTCLDIFLPLCHAQFEFPAEALHRGCFVTNMSPFRPFRVILVIDWQHDHGTNKVYQVNHSRSQRWIQSPSKIRIKERTQINAELVEFHMK